MSEKCTQLANDNHTSPTILYLATDPDLELLLCPTEDMSRPRVIVEIDRARALDRIKSDVINGIVTENRLYEDSDGKPFIEVVKKIAPETPVVVYAGPGPASNEEVFLDSGADAFYWQTTNPNERKEIRKLIINSARKADDVSANNDQREDLEIFAQLSDDAFAAHDFVRDKNITYPGLKDLAPMKDSKFTIDDAFKMIYEGDLEKVLEKNDAVFNKEPWAFDSINDDVGWFSEEVRIRKEDESIAHCLMQGVAIFEDEKITKMYNCLSDMTRDFEYDWKSRNEKVLLETNTYISAAKRACRDLIRETDCTAAWIIRHPLTRPEPGDDLIATEGEYSAFIDDTKMDPAVKRLYNSVISEQNWSSQLSDIDLLSEVDKNLVYSEKTTGATSTDLYATPIFRQGIFYGVLTVVRCGRITDILERLLVNLSASLAYRNEMELKQQALNTNSLTEVNIRINEGHFLQEFYNHYTVNDGTELRARKLSINSNELDEYIISCRSPCENTDDLVNALAAIDSIQDVSVINQAETPTFIISSDEVTLKSLLKPHACVVRQIEVTQDAVSVTIDAPPRVNVRQILTTVTEVYSKVVFKSRQKRAIDNGLPSNDNILTKKQLDALQVATHLGFFERPQQATASDVADVLDLSRSTALHHIRNAEYRIFSRMMWR